MTDSRESERPVGWKRRLAPAVNWYRRFREARRERRQHRHAEQQWQQQLQRFEADRVARRARFHDAAFRVQPRAEVVSALRRDGFVVLKQVLDHELLQRVRNELEFLLDRGAGLTRSSHDAARARGDLEASSVFLDEAETARGQTYFRRLTNQATVKDPLLRAPTAVPLVFNELCIDIAAGYLDCFPAVGGLNLRKSFANGLPEYDTQYYHSDPNSPLFLKVFAYLNDVDQDGGPFCYVKGSHRTKFPGWRHKYRWTHEEIVARYGAGNVHLITAQVGDLIFADTTGFHRGSPLVARDRSMLTANYVIHSEFEGRPAPFRLLRSDFESLNLKQRAAADFLEVIDDRGVPLAA